MTTESDNTGPSVPVVCEECETRSQLPIDEVADAIRRHNNQVHDGAEHATVDPELRSQIADLAAKDLKLL